MTLILIQNDPLTLITLRFLSTKKYKNFYFRDFFIFCCCFGEFFIKCKSENPIRKVVFYFSLFLLFGWTVLAGELSYFKQFPLCLVMLLKYNIMDIFIFPPSSSMFFFFVTELFHQKKTVHKNKRKTPCYGKQFKHKVYNFLLVFICLGAKELFYFIFNRLWRGKNKTAQIAWSFSF